MLVAAATAGASVLGLCEKGDALVAAETGKIFKKEKDMKKGKCVAAFCTFLLLSLTQHSLFYSSFLFCVLLPQALLFLPACLLTTASAISPL